MSSAVEEQLIISNFHAGSVEPSRAARPRAAIGTDLALTRRRFALLPSASIGVTEDRLMAAASINLPWQRSLFLLTTTIVGVVVVGTMYWAQIVFIPVALAIFLTFLLAPV